VKQSKKQPKKAKAGLPAPSPAPAAKKAKIAAAAGACLQPGRKWTAEQVAQGVCGLGTAYEQYRDAIVSNDLDGGTLLDSADEDWKECGISNKIHIKKIRKMLAE
jgi:hypothetical protein